MFIYIYTYIYSVSLHLQRLIINPLESCCLVPGLCAAMKTDKPAFCFYDNGHLNNLPWIEFTCLQSSYLKSFRSVIFVSALEVSPHAGAN